MLSTIKICFSLYYENLKTIIKSDNVYDLETMNIEDIESEVNIIHMKYILTSIYSISQNTIQWVSYTHMINMIDKYYERYGNLENKSLSIDNKLNDKENNNISNDDKIQETIMDNPQNIPKGWFFNK